MKVNGQDYRTVWMEDRVIKTINQLCLPERFEIVSLHDVHQVVQAIRTMVVRGAPAIGATGAYGLAQAALQLVAVDLDQLDKARQLLQQTRPTAHDLTHGLEYVFSRLAPQTSLPSLQAAALAAAQTYADQSVEACRQIGIAGAGLIHDGDTILTHCNAGALAAVDYGTALAVIRMAVLACNDITVFVDETRPRLQGAMLTAWELQQENIPHYIIADNAAGYYMKKGEINVVLTGADRVAQNGDIANKIGTYEKAVLAKENGIPFYVAAPISTVDIHCNTGGDIRIEERAEAEVLSIKGVNIAPADSHAKNPAFDVTPAKYIAGIITEKGIIEPGNIKNIIAGNV